MLRADRGERRAGARQDLPRCQAEVLETERDLRVDTRENNLVLRLLEQRRDDSCEFRRTRDARVLPADRHPPGEVAAVEMGNESSECAQQRRLTGTGCAEQRDELPGLDGQRDIVERRPLALRIRERQMLGDG